MNIKLKTRRKSNRRRLLLTALGAFASWVFSAAAQELIVVNVDYRAVSYPAATTEQRDGKAGADVDAEKLLQLAKEEIHQDDFAAADSTLRAYLQRQPNSAEGLYLLGEVLMRRNKPKESLSAFTSAAALRRPTGEELRVVGLNYILLEDYVDAIKWLKRAVEFSPGNAEVWYSLGRAQYSEGDYEGAEISFRKTLVLDDRSVKAENNLGLALAAQNQPEKAIEAYRRAVGLQESSSPQSEQPLLNLGLLLITRNRPQEAVTDLVQATAIAPACATCHEALGRAFLASDRLPDAQVEMERAVKLEPNNPRFHFVLGSLYKRMGEIEKSKIELQKSAMLYGAHSTPTTQ